VETFRQARPLVEGTGAAPLEVRALAGEAWALMQLGEIRDALGLLDRARQLAESPEFSDVDRADVLFRLAVCRYKLASFSTALTLFDEALRLAEASGLPCDLLRADILGWRSRFRRRQRDYVAAREDVERALELAQDLGDRRTLANTYFQASLITEKMGHWVQSRNYAQRARALYEELEDERTVGRLLVTLGGLTFLLGNPEQAVKHLNEAVAHAVEVDSPPDAAQALSGLALVHLQQGAYEESERHARKALELLQGREDFLDEVGQVRLTLGRSLLERGRLEEADECFRAADALFEQLALVNHRARAWVALGDLASRRGDETGAARLYRNAAEALQDVRF
jgi:tetratricopeptide (TPR) repeat protein